MTDLNKPMLAGNILNALYWSVRDGKKVDNIPGLIEQILTEDIWREIYIEEIERTVTYERFEDFITTPPPEGLGATVKTLERLLCDNEVALNLLDEALQGKPGGQLENKNAAKTTLYNVQGRFKAPAGTSRTAVLLELAQAALAQAARHAIAAGNYTEDPEPLMALAGEIERLRERVEAISPPQYHAGT